MIIRYHKISIKSLAINLKRIYQYIKCMYIYFIISFLYLYVFSRYYFRCVKNFEDSQCKIMRGNFAKCARASDVRVYAHARARVCVCACMRLWCNADMATSFDAKSFFILFIFFFLHRGYVESLTTNARYCSQRRDSPIEPVNAQLV